jgi:hypothetical protein
MPGSRAAVSAARHLDSDASAVIVAAMLWRSVVGVFLSLRALAVLAQSQDADPNFDASVPAPAYTGAGPVVAIDEAHFNFHTESSRYEPLAKLLRNDGYTVRAGTELFSAASLASADVLVIANAGIMNPAGPATPAFTPQECAAVVDWVRGGGALLLIADHAPAGAAAATLSQSFGVEMGQGWSFDLVGTNDITTQIVFTRANGLLGEHPILRGRNADEAIDHVRSFTGQSLTVPDGAAALLRFPATAREAPQTADLEAIGNAVQRGAGDAAAIMTAHSFSIEGRAQGLAMPFGAGRVVVLGEAAMLTAQILTLPNQAPFPFGMNVQGPDDKQFALNVLHWLSGSIE